MAHSSTTSEPSLNIPQVAIVLILGYIVYRAFFKSSPQSALPQQQRPPAVDPDRLNRHIETLQGIFPHVSRAALEAELIRNGGSIEIATERMFSPGGLPEPAGSQPQRTSPRPAVTARPSPPTPNPQSRPSNAGPSSAAPTLVQYPDLLTRYNLHHRLREEKEADAEEAEKVASGKAPSGKARGKAPATKHDRMLAHKEKRDEMILAARRRVEKMEKP